MIEREKTIKRFITGISVLTHYITLCGSCNLRDINVVSENLVRDLLRIFYGWKLHNVNEDNCYNTIYDLIDKGLFRKGNIEPFNMILEYKKGKIL